MAFKDIFPIKEYGGPKLYKSCHRETGFKKYEILFKDNSTLKVIMTPSQRRDLKKRRDFATIKRVRDKGYHTPLEIPEAHSHLILPLD